MKQVFVAAVALLLTLIPGTLCWADVVELKTGQRVEGTLKQADQMAVTMEVGGQTITFKLEQVRTIYYGAAPGGTVTMSAQDEPMKSLRALQSVVQAGLTYRDYAPRVSEAKIKVDEYLRQPVHQDDGLRATVAEAIGYYVLASSAWNMAVATSPRDLKGRLDTQERLRKDPLVSKCPNADKALQLAVLGGTDFLTFFWSCAADKIAEAEKLLGGEKK